MNWKYILIIIVAAMLLVLVVIWQGAIPFVQVPWMGPQVDQEVLNALEGIRERAGSVFSGIEPVEFTWNVKRYDKVESVIIKGRGIEAREIVSSVGMDLVSGLKEFFEESGFEQDLYNVSAGTVSEAIGYRKHRLVCIINSAASGGGEDQVLFSGPLNVEVKCGKANIITDPTLSTKELISALFAEKYSTKVSAVDITIEKETESHARGSAYINDSAAKKGAGSYGMFLASKKDGNWELVFDGRGQFECKDVSGYGFSEEMISDCITPLVEPELVVLEEAIKKQVGKGDGFSVALKSNPTTGYAWEPEFNSEFVELINKNYTSDSHEEGMVGVGGTETFDFLAKKAGDVEISFSYFRSWEGKDSAIETKVFKVEIK